MTTYKLNAYRQILEMLYIMYVYIIMCLSYRE